MWTSIVVGVAALFVGFLGYCVVRSGRDDDEYSYDEDAYETQEGWDG